MLPISLKGFPVLARPHVLNKRLFVINLVPKRLTDWRHLGKKERWELIQRVIVPTVSDANECFLYTDPKNFDEDLLASASDILDRDKKRFKIMPGRQSFADTHQEFWIDWNWNRGSVVWFQSYDKQLATEVFAQCFDPIAMENPAVYLGQNVATLAKRRTSGNESVCFVLPSGIEHLFLFSNVETIGVLFDLAMKHCQFTEDFQMCYGGV